MQKKPEQLFGRPGNHKSPTIIGFYRILSMVFFALRIPLIMAGSTYRLPFEHHAK